MNEVLVETSIWVDHFRRNNESLVDLRSLDMAMSHPMIVTELACGTPPSQRTGCESVPECRHIAVRRLNQNGRHEPRRGN